MNIKDIRKKTIKELYSLKETTKSKLHKLDMDLSVGKFSDTSARGKLKKIIAKVSTVISENKNKLDKSQ